MKVSLAMLLKTNVEKMSENRPLAMLMKIDELKSLSGDVHERKGGYGPVSSDKRVVRSNGSSAKMERKTEQHLPALLVMTARRAASENHKSQIANHHEDEP
jgi:hypothetical protein